MSLVKLRELIKKHKIKIIDFRFVDMPGLWQHFSVTVDEINQGLFDDGIGFDGSSIRGFQEIHESDMVLLPDVDTAFVDPFCQFPTLNVICDVYEPGLKPYLRSPRTVAKMAEIYLKSTAIADTAYYGPELEFFIFDDVRYSQGPNCGYYYIDSIEASWNTGRDEQPNLGYKPRYKEGYFPVPPHDTLQDIRSEIVLDLLEAGVQVEVHHHEVATGGQNEIDMRFAPLVRMADNVMIYKYMVKNVARKHSKVATFMPKPMFADNGSGMHVHQSLWKDGKPLFYSKSGYALISKTCMWYIGGLLKHAPAILAIAAPTTNSYKRLVPGYEAPVNLAYSQRNRSAACRIPMYNEDPKAKRVEFRPPDPSCNPYLTFAALLMAGLDGVENRIDPGDPIDKNLYDLPPQIAKKIKQVPGSLEESISALEKDHDFLLKGGVFTEDLLQTWINYKRLKEIDEVRLRPHPWEFHLYFDC
ncbi:MAG: type I glutamate--ammonia ligase [Gammaproteobacteria bacterium]